MSIVAPISRSSLRDTLHPGAYFTDGIRLYRVVRTMYDPWKERNTAELEDCLTLGTSVYSLGALETMDLELVRE